METWNKRGPFEVWSVLRRIHVHCIGVNISCWRHSSHCTRRHWNRPRNKYQGRGSWYYSETSINPRKELFLEKFLGARLITWPVKKLTNIWKQNIFTKSGSIQCRIYWRDTFSQQKKSGLSEDGVIASWTDASLTLLGFAIIVFLKTILKYSLNINKKAWMVFFIIFFISCFIIFCLECCR